VDRVANSQLPKRSSSRLVAFCRSAPIPRAWHADTYLVVTSNQRFIVLSFYLMKINKGTNQLVSAFRVFTKQYDAQYDAETVSDWGEIELNTNDLH
jgi:hypothetical protein